jgi:nucleoside-diphosphate-sugar epimerase
MYSSSTQTIQALVTGGAGFIGSHIAQALLDRGARVIVVDDFSTGDERNLTWRGSSDGLELVQGDVRDAALMRKLVQECDWVFHEAAVASVPQSVDQPEETNAINLDATLQLLIAARDAGVQRFVFASSSAIYGENEVKEKHEELPVQPLTPYALQKYGSERYAQMFYRLYGLETVALRYFNVFGPRQSSSSPYSGVIAKFCTTMLAGQAPTIFGDGLQARDFVYVDNAVAANLLAAEQPAEKVAGRVFNVAGGQTVTLLDLVAELNQLTHQQLEPLFQPARAGDIRHSQADISAARQHLGYEPLVPWTEGLRHTLDFYRGL